MRTVRMNVKALLIYTRLILLLGLITRLERPYRMFSSCLLESPTSCPSRLG